jgi:hypothetical protein
MLLRYLALRWTAKQNLCIAFGIHQIL